MMPRPGCCRQDACAGSLAHHGCACASTVQVPVPGLRLLAFVQPLHLPACHASAPVHKLLHGRTQWTLDLCGWFTCAAPDFIMGAAHHAGMHALPHRPVFVQAPRDPPTCTQPLRRRRLRSAQRACGKEAGCLLPCSPRPAGSFAPSQPLGPLEPDSRCSGPWGRPAINASQVVFQGEPWEGCFSTIPGLWTRCCCLPSFCCGAAQTVLMGYQG